MSEHYILDGKKAVPCDLMTWGKQFSEVDRHVAMTDDVGRNIRVSTVFLGLDHRFGNDGPPMIFETMIFGGEHDQYQERYSTWEEAEAGHKVACELAGVPFAAHGGDSK